MYVHFKNVGYTLLVLALSLLPAFAGPGPQIKAQCFSDDEPNSKVKYYYTLEPENGYHLSFYGMLPVHAAFRNFKGEAVERYPLENPEYIYWEETSTYGERMLWELRDYGNYLHGVYTAGISLNTQSNKLLVTQTSIRWLYYTGSGDFREPFPEIVSRTGEFTCNEINK